MYSTNPENDAAKFYAALDAHSAEVLADRKMYEELFLEAAATGDGSSRQHGDAETDRVTLQSKLVPLTTTMQQLCESSDAGKLAMQALLMLAKHGNAHAVAAIKALAREYGEQKAG